MGRAKNSRGNRKKVVVDGEPEPTHQPEEQPNPPESPLQEEQALEESEKHLEEAETIRTSTTQMSDKGRNEEEHEGDIELSEDHNLVVEPKRKRQRGPTKMKDIAKDPNSKVRVDFTNMGEPCGPGSVTLSSYLGPLVREHVPYTIKK